VTSETHSAHPHDFYLRHWLETARAVSDTTPPIAAGSDFETPIDICDAEVLQCVLGLLYHLCGIQTTQEGPVTIHERRLATGFEIALRFQMSPTFNVVFKELLSGQDPLITSKSLNRAPDSYITMLMAQRIAARHYIKIWMQMEVRGQASIHVIINTSVRQNASVKESPMVLVIEDTKPIGLLMEMYLHMAGFRTMLANDGIVGMEMAEEHKPDLITLDVMMPRKDGWQVLGELKSNPVTSPIPVIIISVLKDRQVGFEHGASDYLPKPVVRENLIASARRLTTPVQRTRRFMRRGLNAAVYISTIPVLTDNVGAAFPVGTLHYCETGSTAVLDDILALATAPDLILVDCTDQFSKALSTIFRLRLIDSLDAVPIAVIAEKPVLEYLRFITHDIVDGFYEPQEFSRELLMRDFRDTRSI
jgi:CheY-like chemotaxis protein